MGREEKRLLIVDDDDAIRALLFTVVRRRGFTVDLARNGVEALQRLSVCRYSLVLLDLMMPLMSGQAFLDELQLLPREERPLVVILTAGAEPQGLDPALVAGIMRKPFDIELLLDTITGCLSSVEARAQPDTCGPPGDKDEYAKPN
ncbi:MAG TPA: response regulator [Thermoanaerobaculia bacterium]|nr:response regulator [Thermoanaerobaculia bacterium]